MNRCMVESGVFSEVGDVAQQRDSVTSVASCTQKEAVCNIYIENKRVSLNISLRNIHLLQFSTMPLRKP